MVKWIDDWPMLIHPKESHRVHVQQQDRSRAAGEVTYHINGMSESMAFKVRLASKTLFVDKLHGLKTSDPTRPDTITLGYQKDPGGASFILAGNEGSFITNGEHAG